MLFPQLSNFPLDLLIFFLPKHANVLFLLLDSNKSMSDVLEEFQEGGRLSNYNTDGVSTIESVLIKKLQFVAVNDKTELEIPKFGYFSSWFFLKPKLYISNTRVA